MASVNFKGLALVFGRNMAGLRKCGNPNFMVVSRGIAGKLMREKVDKPAPFDYKKWTFNVFWTYFDKTSHRFDENTKIVVVEGAHGVGKSKFAAELAEELDMLYMPQTSMDQYYKSPYGHWDLRDYNAYLMPRIQTYDEADFAKNPFKVDGCVDRLMAYKYRMKFHQYWKALRHLFNTGQGVVLESNPFSHYIQIDAAYNTGYVDKTSLAYLDRLAEGSHHWLLRPNLIVYLDAPVDVVQRKIKERGHECDKNSPVWDNSSYLNDMYSSMKRDYLKKAQKHSQVLVYDWSEPAETEVVVEDIESMNFDHYGLYDIQQSDWRLYNEKYANQFRFRYSQGIPQLIAYEQGLSVNYEYDAEKCFLTAEEIINLKELGTMLPGHDYEVGYNTIMGDSWFDIYLNPFYEKRQVLHNNDFWYPFDEYTIPERSSTNKFDYVP